MKRLIMLLAVALCLPIIPAAGEKMPLPDKIELYYFYDNLCASCDATAEFDAVAAEALSGIRDQYPYELYRFNVYTEAGKERFSRLCAEMGLDAEMLTLPLLIAGGRVFQGDEAIEKNLREAFLVAGEDLFVNETVYNPATKKTGTALFEDYKTNPDAVTVVYFYRITCEECMQTEPVIAALAETEGVEVIAINTRSGNNGERISAFFDAYAVPDGDRMVPIAFTGKQYYAGFEAISKELPGAVEGAETGFAFP